MDSSPVEETNAHNRVTDILQYMISTNEYKDYCFKQAAIHIPVLPEQKFLPNSVEGESHAWAHLDKETRDQLLASSGRGAFEVECDRREMDEVRLRDRQINAVIAAKYNAQSANNKYARPTYVVKNMKSISDRGIICHQPYMNPEVEIDLNRNKSAKMRARNRRPMFENMDNSDALGVQRIHRSSRKLRLILHEFCQKFLADCYVDNYLEHPYSNIPCEPTEGNTDSEKNSVKIELIELGDSQDEPEDFGQIAVKGDQEINEFLNSSNEDKNENNKDDNNTDEYVILVVGDIMCGKTTLINQVCDEADDIDEDYEASELVEFARTHFYFNGQRANFLFLISPGNRPVDPTEIGEFDAAIFMFAEMENCILRFEHWLIPLEAPVGSRVGVIRTHHNWNEEDDDTVRFLWEPDTDYVHIPSTLGIEEVRHRMGTLLGRMFAADD